jgi:hypothetical protein
VIAKVKIDVIIKVLNWVNSNSDLDFCGFSSWFELFGICGKSFRFEISWMVCKSEKFFVCGFDEKNLFCRS